jgi:hypothetical protein
MSFMRSPAGFAGSPGRRVALFAVAFVVVLAAACCSPTMSDWQSAQKTNTVEAYQRFVAKHPRATQVGEAKLAIDGLEWEAAKRQNSVDACARYLEKHSEGRFAGEARRLSEELEWSGARAKNSPTAYLAYFRAHRDSTRLMTGRGTVTSAIAYPMGGGLWMRAKGATEKVPLTAGTMDEAPVLWIEVNGARVDMTPEEAGRLGIITFQNDVIVTRSGSIQATIVRDKASGKILTIDTTGKP